MVKLLGIIGILLLVFIAFVGFLYTAFWFLTVGIDERYKDIDTHFCTPEELQEIKNKVTKRKKERYEEYLKKNKENSDGSISADIHSSSLDGASDSKNATSDI